MPSVAINRPSPVSNGAEAVRESLLKKYSILAVNKTTEHSPVVLENLLLLLDHAFCPKDIQSLGHFRYLFAYEGHDDHYDIAAFHPEARAISIGGLDTYPSERVSGKMRIKILSALAHEIGHAFVMDKVTPEELKRIAIRFGGWAPVFHGQRIRDFYSKSFFSPYPEESEDALPIDRNYVSRESWKKTNLTSAYAEKNVHEWFADAFAAFILNRLGQSGLLGKNWKNELIELPRRHGDYWVNYNNISEDLTHWMNLKLASG